MIGNVIDTFVIPWVINWEIVYKITYLLEWDPTNECNHIVEYSDWSDWTGWTETSICGECNWSGNWSENWWIESVQSWDGITIDNNDPLNPIVAFWWLPINNSLLVTANWNDSTGLRNRRDKPFASVQAAIDAAQEWDTIVVYGWNTDNINMNKNFVTVIGYGVNFKRPEFSATESASLYAYWSSAMDSISLFSNASGTWIIKWVIKNWSWDYNVYANHYEIEDAPTSSAAYNFAVIKNLVNWGSLTVRWNSALWCGVRKASGQFAIPQNATGNRYHDQVPSPDTVIIIDWLYIDSIARNAYDHWANDSIFAVYCDGNLTFKNCSISVSCNFWGGEQLDWFATWWSTAQWDGKIMFDWCYIRWWRWTSYKADFFYKNTHYENTYYIPEFQPQISTSFGWTSYSLGWNSTNHITNISWYAYNTNIIWDPFVYTRNMPIPPNRRKIIDTFYL